MNETPPAPPALTAAEMIEKLQLATGWIAESHGGSNRNPHMVRQTERAKKYLADVLAALAAPPPSETHGDRVRTPDEYNAGWAAPPPDAAPLHPVSVEDRLRHAWETGFRLAVAYGDNHAHWDGEQRERQWRYFLDAHPLPARPTETPT